MSSSNIFGAFAVQYLVQLPIFIVLTAGIVFAVKRWQRHPRVSQLALIALILLLILRVLGTFLGLWVPIMLSRQAIPMAWGSLFSGVWSLISALVAAVAYTLLLLAVFRWRKD